jgi:hypothetical protein
MTTGDGQTGYRARDERLVFSFDEHGARGIRPDQ